MKRCELSVSANASRLRPGVNVPFAAPSCAEEPASAASCLSVLPEAWGKSLADGCSAAVSSSTAGAGFDVLVAGAVIDAPLELCFDEPPHAASASAATPIARPRLTTG